MRFDSLTVPAFGHFSDFSLSLPSSGRDLHLIYGANEAGKSSLLRAINNLFFGIPTRTPDNFFHANARLLIGATISHGSESLTFFRKKGNKNTLLDSGQNTLDDSALASFLGSVNEDFFQNMFGLNTSSLRAGAAKLLSGEGDLGTAIFSASLGGSPIDDAIKNLEAEADSLFKGRATKTSISLAIKTFKDAERAAREESTTVTAWRFGQTDVKNAQETFAEKDQRHREHRTRWQFVQNCLRALPILTAIRNLESQLDGIEAPELPSDFPKRVRSLQADFSRSTQTFQLQSSQIKKAEAALGGIDDFALFLAATAEFETLQRKAEQHLDNLEDLPDLKARLDQVDLTELEKIPPVSKADQTILREATESLVEFDRQSIEGFRSLENLEIELKTQRAELTETSDLTELEEQCRRADDFTAEKSALPGLEKTLASLRSRQEILIERLEINGDPTIIKIPGAKSIRSEAREHERLTTGLRGIEGRLIDVRDALSEEQISLDHLASQAAIYSQADLAKSREERDAIWDKILKSETIEESLAAAISNADRVADTLRDHADHIAVAAGHQAKIAQLRSKQGNLEADLGRAQNELNDWTKNWQSRSGAKSPIELFEWREEWEKLCEIMGEAGLIEGGIATLQDKERQLLSDLGGSNFATVHRSLKAALNKANQEQGERNSIQKLVSKNEVKKQQLVQQSAALANQLATAREVWEQACATTGISPELSPGAAVETLSERARSRDILLDLRSREAAIENYQSLLGSLASRFHVEPSEPTLTALHNKARIDQNRFLELQKQLDQFKESFPQVKLTYGTEQTALQELVKQAGTSDLESAIRQIEIRTDLVIRLNEQKSALQILAGPTPLEDFIEALEKQDAGKLASEKITLDQAEEQLQHERDEAKAQLDEHLRSQQEMMKANDLAASQKQASADALSAIVADTQRFRQLHYAIDFLKQQVEDYRRKTQGPMVGKTSSFFKALTSGAFEKVAAQVDDKDQPQLIAIRANGEPVPTSGLSEGTADQLYLSLRLAAISLHLENHRPIPLILDDLLMTFDDARIKALLPVLEELSEQTQILIFTHHSHLKDLVGSKVSIHDLA